MIRTFLSVAGLALLTACATEGSAPASVVASAPAENRSAFVGTWSGNTQRGGRVNVTVPERGNASYSFNGQRVPVSSTRSSGNSLVIRALEATITLTPSGNSLSLHYRQGPNQTTATLSRS